MRLFGNLMSADLVLRSAQNMHLALRDHETNELDLIDKQNEGFRIYNLA